MRDDNIGKEKVELMANDEFIPTPAQIKDFLMPVELISGRNSLYH